jgi:hypothetical protein
VESGRGRALTARIRASIRVIRECSLWWTSGGKG